MTRSAVRQSEASLSRPFSSPSVPTSVPAEDRPADRQEWPPRGISPAILLSQVRNTAPFLFDSPAVRVFEAAIPGSKLAYLDTLRQAELDLRSSDEPMLTHEAYFELCLAAHWATAGTFVPTDVDHQIRFKLWHPSVETSVIFKMAEAVYESARWDFRKVTTRWIQAPLSGEILGGHNGEWLSVAAAAYGAFRNRAPEQAEDWAELILTEMGRQARIFQELKEAGDGVGLLKAATLVAHNLGDLDRVLDLWNLPAEDRLRRGSYRAGHEGGDRFGGTLYEAGRLNKEQMSDENHRHFALREPRCLRRSPDFLLPVSPFLDEWGSRLARHPDVAPEEVAVIVRALVDGWERLPRTVGYPRALAGILEDIPGGLNQLCGYLPARAARNLHAGLLRNLCAVPRKRFEDQRAQAALHFCKESR